MSEHMKTGEEIRTEYGMMFDNYHILTPEESLAYKEKSGKKWISLEWLKEWLVLLDIKLSSASNRTIPLSVDGKKEMHRGFLTYNEVDDMIRELKHELEG